MINKYNYKLRLFLAFLKERDCYEQYKEEYLNGRKYENTFEEFFNENIMDAINDVCCRWYNPARNQTFWAITDYQWRTYIMNILINNDK